MPLQWYERRIIVLMISSIILITFLATLNQDIGLDNTVRATEPTRPEIAQDLPDDLGPIESIAIDVYCNAPRSVVLGFPAPAQVDLAVGQELIFGIAIDCFDTGDTATISLPNGQMLEFDANTPFQQTTNITGLGPGTYTYDLAFSSEGNAVAQTTGQFTVTSTESFLPFTDSGTSPPPVALVNEILFQPTGEDAEWVELYNGSGADIDLTGWTLQSRSGDVASLPSWSWPADSYLVVYFGSGTNDNDFSDNSGSYYTNSSAPVLADNEDEVGLTTSGGSLTDFVAWSTTGAYTPTGTLYTTALTQIQWAADTFVDLSNATIPEYLRQPEYRPGNTIERIASQDTDTPDDWRESGACMAGVNDCPEMPTPGTSNVMDGSFEIIEEDPAIQQATKDWTIMWYASADRGLEKALFRDMNEMEEVGSDANINIVVQFDAWRDVRQVDSGGNTIAGRRGKAWRGSLNEQSPNNWRRVTLRVPRGQSAYLGEINSGAPNTLDSFIAWAQTNYPADNYALIIADHGDGWKGIAWDDEPQRDFLKMSELSDALDGYNFELIGFDACLMAGIEVAYQVEPFADVMVASQEVEPGNGWPFDRFLADLANNPGWTATQLGTEIVNDYEAYYSTAPNVFSRRTLSAINLNNVAEFANTVNTFGTELTTGVEDYLADDDPLDNVQVKIRRDRRASEEFADENYIDLRDFANEIETNDVPDQYKTQAQPIVDELAEGGDVIIIEEHGPGNPAANGLSIYFPREQECINRDCGHDEAYDDPNRVSPVAMRHIYALDTDQSHGFIPAGHPMPQDTNFDFPQDTSWDEFLHRYYKPVADACIRFGGGCFDSVTVPVGTPVTLSGSGSTDSDGYQLNIFPEYPGGTEYWFWDLDTTTNTDFSDRDRDRRGGEIDDDFDARGITTDFTCPLPDTYSFRLHVWDEQYDYQRVIGNPLPVRQLPHWKVDGETVTLRCTPVPTIKVPNITETPPDQPIPYTIVVVNATNEVIPEVIVEEILPPATDFFGEANPEPDGGTTSGPAWTITNLQPNSEFPIDLQIQIIMDPELEIPTEVINQVRIRIPDLEFEEIITADPVTITPPTRASTP